MKLTSILLLATVLQVSARTAAQKISYSAKSADLKELFTAIKQQTGYAFFYDIKDLEGARKVTVNLKEANLEEALSIILKDQPLEFVIETNTIFIKRKKEENAAGDLKSSSEILAPPIFISGRVMDENGEPLSGANIMVKGADNQGASTNINGYYKIQNIAAGEYTVIVSFVGYVTKTAGIKVTENGTEAFDFKLAPSLVNLDQVTVAGTLSARKIRAYPATIAVIGQEDLKNRNLNNIANVLEAVPGIIVSPGSEAVNSGNIKLPSGILIRGASGYGVSGIKYLIDGIEIVASGTYSILQTLDPNDIEKIEILKGPMASTLYGSGAGGGVITITTKKGKAGKTKVNFKTMFTQYANDYADYSGYSQNYSLNVSGGDEQFNYLLGAGYNLYPITKLTDINNGIDDKTWSYTAKIVGKVKNIKVDVSLQYGNENSGSGSIDISTNKYRASLGLSQLPISPLNDIRNAQRSFLTSLHVKHMLADNWYHDITIGYNSMNYLTNYYTANYSGSYLNTDYLYSRINARYFMFYDHSWSAALKTSITAGFEYNGYETHNMTMNSTTPLANFFTSSSPATVGAASFSKFPYSTTGYFAEAVTGLQNNLFLTTGIRYDVNPAYGDNISGYAQPRVGLSYVIEYGSLKLKPRVAWGVSSDAPDPTYKTTHIRSFSYYTQISVGNPDIKPQRSEGYEFGADIFYGNNYSLNITYYDQKIKDMIQTSFNLDLTTSPWTFYQYSYNIGEAINRGLEVSAKAVLDPFTLDISYTQTSSKWGDVTGQNSTSTVYPHAPSIGVPKRSLFARLSCKIPSILPWTKKGGNVSVDWRYNGSSYDYDAISYALASDDWTNAPDPKPDYPDINNYYLWQKGYALFNLRADYSLTNYAAVYVDVQNLLDKQGSLNGKTMAQFPGRRINFGFNINF